MIVLLLVLLGALWGGWQARARGGSGFDVAQYAVVHAILFGLAGLFLSIVVLRLT